MNLTKWTAVGWRAALAAWALGTFGMVGGLGALLISPWFDWFVLLHIRIFAVVIFALFALYLAGTALLIMLAFMTLRDLASREEPFVASPEQGPTE